MSTMISSTMTTILTTITIFFFTLPTLAQEHGSPYAPPSTVTDLPEPTPLPPILQPKPDDLQFPPSPQNTINIPDSLPTQNPPSPPGAGQVPTPTPITYDPKKTDIMMCTNSGFGGKCEIFSEPVGFCHDVPEMYRKQVSSIRMDEGQTCLVFDMPDCFGSEDWLRAPGSTNLRGRRFDNRIVSYRCQVDGVDGW